jgi:hypothetical protein
MICFSDSRVFMQRRSLGEGGHVIRVALLPFISCVVEFGIFCDRATRQQDEPRFFDEID